MNRIHWQIDAGHGGFIGGEYVTAPAKMHQFEDGFTVYEGAFNRSVVAKLAYKLGCAGIPFSLVDNSQNDMTLRRRKQIINQRHEKEGFNTVLVSVHGNAGGGTGFEVFTTRGETKSDAVATVFFDELKNEFPGVRMRTDTSLMCRPPAILTENLFFDNRHDAEIMMSDEGQTKIAMAHFNAIKSIDNQFNHISKIK